MVNAGIGMLEPILNKTKTAKTNNILFLNPLSLKIILIRLNIISI